MADVRNNVTEDSLNESWVELHFQNQAELQQLATENSSSRPPSSLQSSMNGNYERLLIEAQNESRTTSNASSRGSPKGPHSPTTQDVPKQFEAGDWIWDWSSRPEAIPPTDIHLKYKHPVSVRPTARKAKLSVRNTSVMRNGLFCLENLPALFLTHACTFFLGAATMFIYLKKYCKLSATTIAD